MTDAAGIQDPISDAEAGRLFAGLSRPLLIAVSGGSDSIALMHLLARWRAGGGGAELPAPLVATVDHGLRAQSAGEAAWVATAAAKAGFQHQTLRWIGLKPPSGIQDAARAARYELLLELAALDRLMPRDILLAHTLDDQAETLLMRLARGSGIDGLSAMQPHSCRTVVQLGHPIVEAPVVLRRPLLSMPKSRLAATLQSANLPWLDDPSNDDARFERVRLRQSVAARAEIGLEAAALARSARRLQQAQDALNSETCRLATALIDDHGGAFGELRIGPGQMPAAGQLVRLVARLLAVFGGVSPVARLSQIEALCQRLMDSSEVPFERLTLGGCLVEVQRGNEMIVRAFRETGRATLPVQVLAPGQGTYWDKRFYVSLSPRFSRCVLVRALGADGIARLPGSQFAGLAARAPRAALLGLPAVWRDDELLAAGSIADADGRDALPLVDCRWASQQARALFWQPDQRINDLAKPINAVKT